MALSEWEKKRIEGQVDRLLGWERKKILASWESFLSFVKGIANFMADIASIVHAAIEIWTSLQR